MDKKCTQCGVGFQISKEDLDFHEKISPTFDGKKFQGTVPDLRPDCRMQRMIFRNELRARAL